MQTVHDQGHDIAAITRSLPTTTPLNDLPAKDLRYRVVATPATAAACLGTPIDPLHHQDHDTWGIAPEKSSFLHHFTEAGALSLTTGIPSSLETPTPQRR
jgi:hypothetical protein